MGTTPTHCGKPINFVKICPVNFADCAIYAHGEHCLRMRSLSSFSSLLQPSKSGKRSQKWKSMSLKSWPICPAPHVSTMFPRSSAICCSHFVRSRLRLSANTRTIRQGTKATVPLRFSVLWDYPRALPNKKESPGFKIVRQKTKLSIPPRALQSATFLQRSLISLFS